MLSRRELFSGVLLGGAREGAGAGINQDGLSVPEIVRALDGIQEELRMARTTCTPAVCDEVEQIRAHQRTFLRSHQKFPDFIEVGTRIWERVQDWQLGTVQPISIEVQPGGRYSVAFGPTTLLLRPDVREDFIGFPYDRPLLG